MEYNGILIIFHFVYVPHFVDPFICQWTLFPMFGCCESLMLYMGVQISLKSLFSILLDICPEVELLDHIVFLF